MKTYIQIAGCIIELNLLYENTALAFEAYEICDTNQKPDIVITSTFNDLLQEQKYTHQGTSIKLGSNQLVFFHRAEHEYLSVLHKIAEIMPKFNAFLFHAAAISYADYAYLFSAPSGEGKSTRARLWMKEYPGSIVINGDKPFIKVTESGIFACGSPWSGKEHWNSNISVPLRAIFLFERANDDENDTIEEVSLGIAFPFLMQQTYIPSDPNSMRKTIHLLKILDGRVKLYRFRSKPTIGAIHKAYETARPR